MLAPEYIARGLLTAQLITRVGSKRPCCWRSAAICGWNRWIAKFLPAPSEMAGDRRAGPWRATVGFHRASGASEKGQAQTEAPMPKQKRSDQAHGKNHEHAAR
jgi:hypothetical protein